MFWKKKGKVTILELRCQVEGCNFTCDDYQTLQKHTHEKHPGLKLQCKVCGLACADYRTLQRHMEWKHPELAKEDSK